MKTFGGGDMDASVWASNVVPCTRLSRMRAFCAAFQRREAMLSPARCMTPSMLVRREGSRVSDDGSQVISSSLRALRRVRDKTRSPRAISAVLSAEPMRPEAPDIRIFMTVVFRDGTGAVLYDDIVVCCRDNPLWLSCDPCGRPLITVYTASNK